MIDWNKGNNVYLFALGFPSNSPHAHNKRHISFVLVCLCGAAYTLLVVVVKINVAHELMQLCTITQDFKNTRVKKYKMHACYPLTCLKFKSSCTVYVYPGELCHWDGIWHCQQLMDLTCVTKCLLKLCDTMCTAYIASNQL